MTSRLILHYNPISRIKLQEVDTKTLQSEIKNYQELVNNLNYQINNYESIVKNFKKNLKKLVPLYEECQDFINRNFGYANEEKTNLVFMKSTITDLTYSEINKDSLFKKISNYEVFRKKVVEDIDGFIPDSHYGHFNFMTHTSLQDGDISFSITETETNALQGEYKWPINYTNFSHYSTFTDKTFTDRTNRFFKEISKLFSKQTIIGEPGTMQILSKNGLKKNYQIRLTFYEKEIRKYELVLRARKKGKEKTENVGCVYIFSNKSLPPNTYKIGSTYGLAEERAEELTGTGHLTPFFSVGEIKIKSAEYYEKSIHKLLNKYRVKEGREFFELELDKIKDCLKQVSELSDKGEKKLTLSDLKKKIKIK